MEGAVETGLDWKPLDKWIRPEKCRPHCGKCSLGCPVEGAKWTAREFVEEARNLGAELLTNTRINRLLVEGGMAVGVEAESSAGSLTIRAQIVVLSGGGKPTRSSCSGPAWIKPDKAFSRIPCGLSADPPHTRVPFMTFPSRIAIAWTPPSSRNPGGCRRRSLWWPWPKDWPRDWLEFNPQNQYSGERHEN